MLTIYPNDGKGNEDLLVWFTEPGDEYYLHMYFWVDVPFELKVDPLTQLTDVALKRVIKKEEEGCNLNEDSNYIGR